MLQAPLIPAKEPAKFGLRRLRAKTIPLSTSGHKAEEAVLRQRADFTLTFLAKAIKLGTAKADIVVCQQTAG